VPNQIYKTENNANAVRWNGEEILVSQKARELGLDPTTLVYRINNWGIERAMTTRKHTPEEVAAIGAQAFAERRCHVMREAGKIAARAKSEAMDESVNRLVKVQADPVSAFLAMPAREEGYRHGGRR
jgi:hypothetical protein